MEKNRFYFTSNHFRFFVIDLYSTFNMDNVLSRVDYMLPYMELEDVDFKRYKSDLLEEIKPVLKEAEEVLKRYGVKSLEITGEIESPREYNFYTDWVDIECRFKSGWKKRIKDAIPSLKEDSDVIEYVKENYLDRSGFWSYFPQTWEELERKFKAEDEFAISELLTLLLIHEGWDFVEKEMDVIDRMNEKHTLEEYETYRCIIPEDCVELYNSDSSYLQDSFFHKALEVFPRYRINRRRLETGDNGDHLLTLLKWMERFGYCYADVFPCHENLG